VVVGLTDHLKIDQNLFAINVNAVTSAKKFVRGAFATTGSRKVANPFAMVG
jgi:hypothetical protein